MNKDALFIACMLLATLVPVIAAALWLAKRVGLMEDPR